MEWKKIGLKVIRTEKDISKQKTTERMNINAIGWMIGTDDLKFYAFIRVALPTIDQIGEYATPATNSFDFVAFYESPSFKRILSSFTERKWKLFGEDLYRVGIGELAMVE